MYFSSWFCLQMSRLRCQDANLKAYWWGTAKWINWMEWVHCVRSNKMFLFFGRWLISCFLYPVRHTNELPVPFVTYKTLIPFVNCMFWLNSGENSRRRTPWTFASVWGVHEACSSKIIHYCWRTQKKAALLKFWPLKLDHHCRWCDVIFIKWPLAKPVFRLLG